MVKVGESREPVGPGTAVSIDTGPLVFRAGVNPKPLCFRKWFLKLLKEKEWLG